MPKHKGHKNIARKIMEVKEVKESPVNGTSQRNSSINSLGWCYRLNCDFQKGSYIEAITPKGSPWKKGL